MDLYIDYHINYHSPLLSRKQRDLVKKTLRFHFLESGSKILASSSIFEIGPSLGSLFNFADVLKVEVKKLLKFPRLPPKDSTYAVNATQERALFSSLFWGGVSMIQLRHWRSSHRC